jgi:hypothetical protein
MKSINKQIIEDRLNRYVYLDNYSFIFGELIFITPPELIDR